MSSTEQTFADLVLAGRAKLSDIDDYIDRWHDGSSTLQLHDFLGLTWDEYAAWVNDPASLAAMFAARRAKRSPALH
jgi:hypothetical protein